MHKKEHYPKVSQSVQQTIFSLTEESPAGPRNQLFTVMQTDFLLTSD